MKSRKTHRWHARRSAGLTDDDWKSLIKYARNIHFNAGETDNGVYILVSGRVEVIGDIVFKGRT